MARTKVFDEEEVLMKAMHLFWEKGYNATSAQDLVDTLGISRSSMYDTFGDKFQLYKQALELYRKKYTNTLIRQINESADVEKTIRELFQTVISTSLGNQLSKGCFMVNCSIELLPHQQEINAIVTANMLDVEEALARLIKTGQDSGLLAKKHPARAYARFIFNTLSGMRVASRSGIEKKVLDDVVKITLSALHND